MRCLYFILLQIPQANSTGFIAKAGILVIVLTLFIIFQAIFSRKRKNSLIAERNLLRDQFDSQIMENKLEIQEATFESLGIELHDNIGQLLSTAKLFIGITERNLDQPPLTLTSANETLDKAIIELRDLSKSLDKDWLLQFDLYRNLLALTDKINSAGEIKIEVKRSSHVLPIGAEEQFMFYRVLQEGIQNVMKHSRARNLTINITHDEKTISALLADDGIGFDVKQKHTGLGIKNMQKRIKILKGKINWVSSTAGTTLTIRFPVKKL